MWQILRRIQGEGATTMTTPPAPGSIPAVTSAHGGHHVVPITNSQSKRIDPFVINQRTVALNSCLGDAPPEAPDMLTASYGHNVYAKLLRYATNSSVTLRRKAYGMLLELFAQKEEHAISALREGGMPIFTNSLRDTDDDVRGLACMALQVAVRSPLGQELLLREGDGHCQAILAAVNDVSPAVVAEALRLCYSAHMVTNEGAATAALIELDCIPLYASKISSPDDDVCAMALAALGRTFDVKEAFILANDVRVLEPTVAVLKSRQDPNVLVEACELVSKVAFYSAGKRAAINERIVEATLPLITHGEAPVRVAATGAVVALTIAERGKTQAIEAGVVHRLHTLLRQEEERDVLSNSVRIVCNVSEDPVARQQLSVVVPRLQELSLVAAEGQHTTLRASVDRAIAMINWHPGDMYS